MVDRLKKKEELIAEFIEMAGQKILSPEIVNPYLESISEGHTDEHERLSKILKRPGVKLAEILGLNSLSDQPAARKLLELSDPKLRTEIIEQIEIDLKYEGYIQRQVEQIEKFDKFEDQKIPLDYDYSRIKSLSSEGREKLSKVRPESIGQASRISGVTPSDVSILMVSLRG